MKSSEAKVIKITYELRNGNKEGEIIESVNKENPAEFLFGAGKLNQKFEENVIGLSEDDHFEFTIPSAEAYGGINEKAIVEVPKDIFIVDGKLAEDLLEVGKILNMQDQDGNPLRGKVIEIGENTIKMDFNHPLAGLDLHFKGQVLGSRDALPEEVSHGHVHTGEHGH
jgi:FKBP-type peptidyl-prolyl cis-trans isomerase SlyD